ncbi:XRN 5'-3' exonuclease N-terminus-domain-containing protein [Baffinella frigidus]|nr:XRN 5'-3' exonuclease N-terminus-domain-containing protein [Cryptophyta sp. CCMP2293]
MPRGVGFERGWGGGGWVGKCLTTLCFAALLPAPSSLPSNYGSWNGYRAPAPASWKTERTGLGLGGRILGGTVAGQGGAGLLRLRGGGVPKFYGWLSERYPLINHDILLDPDMPEVDNLYLDMNGIIHPCTHGNADELRDLTREEMFLAIFSFLDNLVQLVKPRQVLFLAVDGVAPRAKMNQQRARRFKAAKGLAEQITKAKERGY